MSLLLPVELYDHVTHESLTAAVERAKSWRSRDIEISTDDLTDAVLSDLLAAAEKGGNKSFARVITSIQSMRSGDFSKSIPRFDAAASAILAYLRHNIIDGWVYCKDVDGHLHPYLVTKVNVDRTPRDDPYLNITMIANGGNSQLGATKNSVALFPQDVTRKKVEDILLAKGIFKETAELKAQYEKDLEKYRIILTTGFAEQYRYFGTPLAGDRWGDSKSHRSTKVIHDISPMEIPAFSTSAPSILFSEGNKEPGIGPVPTRTILYVFDLAVHEFIWVNTKDLMAYEYNPNLRDVLVLPPEQSDLLDILTTDVETFIGDVIEGKSAGNVILCKGPAGVGKTLTAEVYSEIIERPLYSIHSGSLGTSAQDIRKNLETIFKRAKRWNAVLLLDEADVFVLERGESIEQNAIVAEFLRTLEYFSGLMFMTTNRADSIDDAIVSRCAAIIGYDFPSREAARRIWEVQAANNGVTLEEDLLEDLLTHLPKTSGRDVKMLLRLALRVSKGHDEPLSLDLFRRCSMFRAIEFVE